MSRTADAHMIELHSPGWAVVWGEWHRTFTAWAMWAPASVCVETRTPEELAAAMRQAETKHNWAALASHGMYRQAP